MRSETVFASCAEFATRSNKASPTSVVSGKAALVFLYDGVILLFGRELEELRMFLCRELG